MKTTLLVLVLPGLLFADFRYEQTTRITGGMVTKMSFGKKPEPTTSSHFFKSGKMATVSKDSKTIIDFDSQLFTIVNIDKKTYSQMTFEEMRQMMADLQSEMKDTTKNGDVAINMKFDAKATGIVKEVSGVPAKEVIFTIEMGVSDGKNAGTATKMVADSWHSEAVPGYAEYKAFHERLADKGSWMNPGQLRMQMGGQQGMAEGMKKLAEEMQKTPGIAVLTITRMSMPGMGMEMSNSGGTSGNPGQANSTATSDAAKQAAAQAAGDAAGRQAGGSVGGLVGGALGSTFGGFGKKKKTEAPKPAETEAAKQPANDAASSARPSDATLMMESVTDTSGFSTASISDDVFAVPAGFAKVESDLSKRRKK